MLFHNLSLEKLQFYNSASQGYAMSPGGHCWGYYLGTLSFLSSHSNLSENRTPIDEILQMPDL